MIAVSLNQVELIEERSELDARERVRFAFPLSSADGTAATAAVVFELAPGDRLGRHTDSAEEVLLVLEGVVEATVGDERSFAEAGTLVVVPALVPHGVENVGERTARVLGFFAASTVVSIFERAASTGASQVFVAGAPTPLAAPLPAPAAV